MAIKLTISVLFFIFYGALKCIDELEFNFPIRASSPTCDGDFVPLKGNCYKIMENNQTFADSQKDCEENGADLASIHNNETNFNLVDLLTANNSVEVLIGLQFSVTGNYKWTDRSPYNFTYWPTGYNETKMAEFVGKCVLLQKTGYWINKDCSESDKPHICQKLPPEESTEVPPTEVAPTVCPTSNWFFDGGTISSPGYPYNYDGAGTAPLDCTYVFAASPAPISINFTELSTCDVTASVISIYEGVSEQGPALIRNLTGGAYVLPITVTSSKPTMFMRFTSSKSGKWYARWGPSPSP